VNFEKQIILWPENPSSDEGLKTNEGKNKKLMPLIFRIPPPEKLSQKFASIC